jgi:hypothetical protein
VLICPTISLDTTAEASPRRTVLVSIFIACMTVYNANCRLIAAGDSIPARLLPFAILTKGTVYLESFGPVPPGAHWFSPTRDGRLISLYPIVLPVLATPLFLPAAVYVAHTRPDAWRFETVSKMMEKLAASVIAALSVVVIWLALRRLTTRRNSLLLAAAYAFGTQTWSTSSQALWQHGLAELLLASALLLLVRFGASRAAAAAVGALCGLVIFNRPPDALFAAAVALFYILRGRGARLRFGLGVLAASLPFLLYNLYFFRRLLGGYQGLLGTSVFEHSIPEGVAGLLVSPGKGLLVFAPFFLFLAVGGRLKLGAAGRLPATLLWIAFIAQLVLYGMTDWRAGWCYGPRFLTDAMPFLTVALVPAVERLRRPAVRTVFVLCVAFAFFVQAVGAFCFPVGGSYKSSKEEFWRPAAAQFLVEAKAGLARPEFLSRTWSWARKRLRRHPPTFVARPISFYTVTPCRAVDTRQATGPFGGPSIKVGQDRSFRLQGRCGIPGTARSVSLNVTVLEADAPGELVLFPDEGEEPIASAVSYLPGRIRANNGIFPLGPGASLQVSCRQNSGGVHVLLDVNGYFE